MAAKVIPAFKDLIVYESEDYIAINKPPYISSLDERATAEISILQLAKGYEPDAQLCHRLDKETSGLLLIARNPNAYRNASMAFEHRRVTKIYHAVVHGVHDYKGVNVFLPLAPVKYGIVVVDKLEGKEAETIFNTVDIYQRHTLIECLPITGRTHQIRVHLACLKSPIVADKTYGGKDVYLSEIKKKNFNLKKDAEEQPLIQRVVLHAAALIFPINEDGDMIKFEAKYPKDIQAFVNQLDKNR